MKVAVPNDLRGIPLERFQELSAIENPTEVDQISILLGLDIRVIRALKSSSVTKLSAHLDSLLKRDYALVRQFKLDGKLFGFIPNLDQASYGEIDDIEAFIVDFKTAHKAMAVLYRPIIQRKGDKYLIEDYEPGKYDELMKQAPLDVVLGANVFFYTLISDLLNSIPNYMEAEALAAISRGLSTENGEDILGYIHSLRETFASLKKSPSFPFISVIPT